MKTPLVELKNYRNGNIRVFAKLEMMNPNGSIKDRIGEWLVNNAVYDGKVTGNTIIIEASSGNTGIGIAYACLKRKIKCLLIIPDSTSKEKVQIMKSLGAEILLIEGTIDDCIRTANIFSKRDNYLWLNQFDNSQCIDCHYYETAYEIEYQLKNIICETEPENYKPDSNWKYNPKEYKNILVCAMGTTGTIMGCSKYLKEEKGWEIIGVQPKPNCKIEGLKNLDIQRIPKIFDKKAVDMIYQVGDKEAVQYMKELCKSEGIFGGPSTGAAFFVALRMALQQLVGYRFRVNIVFICPDTGRNYMDSVWK